MSGKRYTVTSAAPGFRRGGRSWPAGPVEVARSDFSDEQWDAITADPTLTVNPAGSQGAGVAPATDTVPVPPGHVGIVCQSQGFRRAGRSWPAGCTVLPQDALDADQLAMLEADPMFSVIDGGAPAYTEQERADMLDAAVETLVAAERDPAQWMKNGAPRTDALAVLSGLERVSATERDQAWERHGTRHGERLAPPDGNGDADKT